MSHSRSLRQLLRIRQIEEEQSRTLLEAALGELNRLERALVVARERELKGRALVQASLRQGSMVRMGDAATRDISMQPTLSARRGLIALRALSMYTQLGG